MQDVADDRHRGAVEPLAPRRRAMQPTADGERVEQSLRGVLMGAITRVDDPGIDPARIRKHSGRTGCAVAHDHGVCPHRGERLRGVLQALPLRHTGTFCAEVDDVGTQPLCRSLEGDPGAGGILEEQVDHGLAAQGREFLDLTPRDIRHVFGDVEYADGIVPAEVARAEQVPHAAPPRSSMVIESSPSTSVRLTFTRSSCDDGRFLPMKSGRMGSSRCPRSMSTASLTMFGRPKSFSASSAARMVRPEYSTSSTSTTVAPSMPFGGSWVGEGVRVLPRERSSRYMVTSSAPAGTGTPEICSSCFESRWARWTPRVGMPRRTNPDAPRLDSRISWAIRVNARVISACCSTVRTGNLTPFPASLDGI